MNQNLKKLQYKAQSPVLVLGAPPEFKATKEAFGVPVHTAAKGTYDFVIAFAKSQAEAKAHTKTLKKALADDKSLVWIAYPKGTSKKYQADVNRDSLHALMETLGFEGVRLVALDDDWSAMRFKLGE
ncbi:MAG TPA: hypothetical protein VHV51_03640 [Polyangiaceae bacterium]|jgi:hypothetical protein|nr:hypothetical protein [Polyangiaceae bacterium]